MSEEKDALNPLVHVLGLQRSGTNYLVELIRQNTTERIILTGDRTVCWKHALPNEQSNNASYSGLSAGNAVNSHPEILICLIAKHPKHWLASAVKPGHDLLIKRKHLTNGGSPNILKLLELYREFYKGWIDLLKQRQNKTSSPFLVFSYEKTLRQPFKSTEQVSKILSLDMKSSTDFIDPTRVPYSKPMNAEKRSNILNGIWHLPDEHDEMVERFMTQNRDLMGMLGHV